MMRNGIIKCLGLLAMGVTTLGLAGTLDASQSQAAAKITMPKEVKVKEWDTKTIKIKPGGFKIKKVTATASKKGVIEFKKITKSSITFRAIRGEEVTIAATIKATKKKKTQTFTVRSRVKIAAQKLDSYTITPDTDPCDKAVYFGNYSENTRQYYMVRSYLNRIEAQKGGELVFTAGTYNLPNTLFVASNTRIRLEKGAILKKTQEAGPALKASTTIFQLISTENSDKEGIYYGHEGDHDISITGEGEIDLNNLCEDKSAIAITMGHNTNVLVDGITFRNLGLGHFMEVDACKNVTIQNCKFIDHVASGMNNKEAINLDTPDKLRDGFNAKWSSKDKTPNENVVINKCVFDNLETGVGTHRYTGDVYQTDVRITNCTFNKCNTAIRALNYKNVIISHNVFTNCIPNDRYPYAMFFAGIQGINFSYNSFTDCGIKSDGPPYEYCLVKIYTDNGYDAGQSVYPPTYSAPLTQEEEDLFMTNTAVRCGRVVDSGRSDYNIYFSY